MIKKIREKSELFSIFCTTAFFRTLQRGEGPHLQQGGGRVLAGSAHLHASHAYGPPAEGVRAQLVGNNSAERNTKRNVSRPTQTDAPLKAKAPDHIGRF